MTRERETRPDSGFELVWAPPTYGSFASEDVVRFRLLLNARGFCVGLVWCSDPGPESASAKVGVTWNVSTSTKQSIWEYVTSCAAVGVDATRAYEAIVADTRGAYWSREFSGFGVDLNVARRWMQAFTDDTSWADDADVPPRAMSAVVQLAPDASLYVGHDAAGEAVGLFAVARDIYVRDDGQWFKVTDEAGDLVDRVSISPLRPSFIPVYDQLRDSALTLQPLLDAFSARWGGDVWLGASVAARKSPELAMASNDAGEPMGLLMFSSAGPLLRACGAWHPCPSNSPWLNGLMVDDVGVDFISVYDELERAGRLDLSVQLAETMIPRA